MLYDFAGQTSGELSAMKGDTIIITQKESNGMPSRPRQQPDLHGQR